MSDPIHEQLVVGLLFWALLSLGTATIGLYNNPREFWKAFWFMSGIWGLIDGLIGWSALLGDPPPLEELCWFLKLNTGLDVLYNVVGIVLLTRSMPILQGFGLAVVLQGSFLLFFDGFFWWRCIQVAPPG